MMGNKRRTKFRGGGYTQTQSTFKENGWRPENLHGKKWEAVGTRTDEKNKIFSGRGCTEYGHVF